MLKEKSFTLVELLTVITLLVLAITIALAGVQGARQKARDTRASESLRQIGVAAGLDYAQYGNWSPDVMPGGIPRFVSEEFYPQATYNAEYYCSTCTYDWQNWDGGDCIIIDIYKDYPNPGWTIERRRCISCISRSCADF